MHEPRGKYNVGMGYAISEIGADHLVVTHDPTLQNSEAQAFKSAMQLGITEAQPSRSLSNEKMKHFYILEQWGSFEKVVGLCFFGPAPRSFIPPDDVLTAINVVTGWDLSMADLLKIGERATNMARVFNAREGFTRKDDTLPERIFQPLENGALAGQSYPRDEFETALTHLYELKGWNLQTGTPTRERLEALGLGWAADQIHPQETVSVG